MADEENNYFLDDSITIVPAEDVPIDGTEPVRSFEEIQKEKRKRKSKGKKDIKKEESKKDEPSFEQAPKTIIIEESKEVKEKPKQKVKPIKKKAKPKPIKRVKTNMAVKDNSEESKTDLPKPDEEGYIHINPDQASVKPEDNNTNDKENSGIFWAIMVGIILIVAIIFGINYLNPNDTLSGKDGTGNSVSIATTETYEYNGFKFGKRVEDGLWYTFVKNGDVEYFIRLHNSPRDLEDVKMEGKLGDSFKNISSVYLTFNPEATYMNYTVLSTAAIGANFVNAFHITLKGACDHNATDACKDRPILTCKNAKEPTIYLKEAKVDPKVTLSENCILIEGEGKDMLKASERLLYTLYGIMLL